MKMLTIIMTTIATLHFINGFAQDSVADQHRSNLKKKTAQGFIVPYSLRYDPHAWSCVHKNGGQEFSFSKRPIDIIVRANNEEKNLSKEELDGNFQETMRARFADQTLFVNVEVKPSENVTINGINFLRQTAIVNLVPGSVQFKTQGRGYQKRWISEKGGQDQIDYYVYSGDNGRISFYLESHGVLSHEDQLAINELFRGFSFDGSACRGPAKLRTLKTIFEVVTDELSK